MTFVLHDCYEYHLFGGSGLQPPKPPPWIRLCIHVTCGDCCGEGGNMTVLGEGDPQLPLSHACACVPASKCHVHNSLHVSCVPPPQQSPRVMCPPPPQQSPHVMGAREAKPPSQLLLSTILLCPILCDECRNIMYEAVCTYVAIDTQL